MPANSSKKRQLKNARYRSFRLSKKIRTPGKPLPTVRSLLRETGQLLWQNKRFFIFITLTYGVLSFLFVSNLSFAGRIAEIRETLDPSTVSNSIGGNVSIFAAALGLSTAYNNQLAGMYQYIILLLTSLAIIYGLRVMYGVKQKQLSVKEAYYKGMTPLVPFLLILLIIILQIIPLGIGSLVYVSVTSTGVAASGVENILWALFLLLMVLLTIYMLASSIFALYIVTLPDMTPLRALRSARELVRHRRSMIVRKLFIIPFLIILLLGVIVVPLIGWLPILADIVFYLGLLLVLPFLHTYIYTIYRKLL